MSTRTIQIELVGATPGSIRPDCLREVGRRLHPDTITDAWYAADCPPKLDWRAAGITRRTWLQWRLACLLRGAR